jgi:proline iminopeptidase
MRLNSYLPNYFLREVHYMAVQSSPSETFKIFTQFNMSGIPWIKNLFRLRTVLDGKNKGPVHLTLRDAYENGDFILLEEAPDEELVVGAVGKFWRPSIAFKKLDRSQYALFQDAGFAKVAWSFRCEPRIGGGTLATFELRVGANDTVSAGKMKAYYSLIGPFSRMIRKTVTKRVEKQLNSFFADEKSRALPGDGLIAEPSASITHGITIEAPPEAIWPWLMQMGCLRGGWYSYDWLDNAGVRSSTQIVAEWQNLKEGDSLNWTPQADAGCFVMRVEPKRTLVLGSCYDFNKHISLMPNVDPLPSKYFRMTWTFHLEPQTVNITRLIVRVRGDYVLPNALVPHLRNLFIRPVHQYMEKKQLQNLKIRAENSSTTSLGKIGFQQGTGNEACASLAFIDLFGGSK